MANDSWRGPILVPFPAPRRPLRPGPHLGLLYLSTALLPGTQVTVTEKSVLFHCYVGFQKIIEFKGGHYKAVLEILWKYSDDGGNRNERC